MARADRQAAVIPYRIRKDRVEVALVTTFRGKRWILPKGWVDEGELPRQAAIREAEEEAGLLGVVARKPLGRYQHMNGDSPCRVDVYAMRGLNHTDSMLMTHLPTEKVIFVSDIYAPSPVDTPPPEAPIPGAVSLIENMERTGAVDVTKVAGGHGSRVGSVEDLLIDAGRMKPTAKSKAKAKAKP